MTLSMMITGTVVHDRTTVLVDAQGPRGGAHTFTVHLRRRRGDLAGAYHDGAGYLPAKDVPDEVARAAASAWHALFTS